MNWDLGIGIKKIRQFCLSIVISLQGSSQWRTVRDLFIWKRLQNIKDGVIERDDTYINITFPKLGS